MLGNSGRSRLACTLSNDGCSTILGATSTQTMEGPSVGHTLHMALLSKQTKTLYAVYWGHTTTDRIFEVLEDYTDREVKILEKGYLSLWISAFGFVGVSIHAVVLEKDNEGVHTTLRTYRKQAGGTYLACSKAPFARHPQEYSEPTQGLSTRHRICSMEVESQDWARRSRLTSIPLEEDSNTQTVCLFSTRKRRDMLVEEALLLQEYNWRRAVAGRREAALQAEEVEQATIVARRKEVRRLFQEAQTQKAEIDARWEKTERPSMRKVENFNFNKRRKSCSMYGLTESNRLCRHTLRYIGLPEFAQDQPQAYESTHLVAHISRTDVGTHWRTIRWSVGFQQAYPDFCLILERVDTTDAKPTADLHSISATNAMHHLLSTSKDSTLLSVRIAIGSHTMQSTRTKRSGREDGSYST